MFGLKLVLIDSLCFLLLQSTNTLYLRMWGHPEWDTEVGVSEVI
jgi:hypothetical protein